MTDMGQADRTLRHTPSGDDGVFDRHKERMQWLQIAEMFPSDKQIKDELGIEDETNR